MTAIEIKPIRTKRDYEAALKDVERLWGAKAGTPEGDRLDVLATLIDAYETEHYPMDPPDPIEAIKFRMEQQGLTRRDLEGLIGTGGVSLPLPALATRLRGEGGVRGSFRWRRSIDRPVPPHPDRI